MLQKGSYGRCPCTPACIALGLLEIHTCKGEHRWISNMSQFPLLSLPFRGESAGGQTTISTRSVFRDWRWGFKSCKILTDSSQGQCQEFQAKGVHWSEKLKNMVCYGISIDSDSQSDQHLEVPLPFISHSKSPEHLLSPATEFWTNSSHVCTKSCEKTVYYSLHVLTSGRPIA